MITIISFLLGLGIGHLQTLILLGPSLMLLLILNSPKKKLSVLIRQISLAVAVTIIGFLLSSALILPLDARHQTYSWSFPNGLSGWWYMITRQDYSGTFLDRNAQVKNAYFGGLDIPVFIDKIPVYLITIWNQYAGLPFIFVVIGIVYIFKKISKPLAIYLLSSYLISGLLFGTYVTLNDFDPQNLKYRLLMGTSHRQYLLGFTFLALFSGIGLNIAGRYLKHFTTKEHAIVLPGILAIVLLTGTVAANYSLANQKSNSLVYNYSNTLLTGAEPNSVIICSSDFACFGLYYQSIVEQKRPDVAILGTSIKGRKNFLDSHHEYYKYLYPESPTFAAETTAYNVGIRPTYLTGLSQFDIDYFGLDGNPFFAIPDNYLTKISLTKPFYLVGPKNDPFFKQLSSTKVDNRDFHLMGFIDYITSYYQVFARYLTEYNQPKEAIDALDTAIYLYPADPRVFDWRQNLYALTAQFSRQMSTSTSSAEYMNQALQYKQENKLLESEAAARKAHYLKPSDPVALQFLLSLYKEYNYPLFAAWTEGNLEALSKP